VITQEVDGKVVSLHVAKNKAAFFLLAGFGGLLLGGWLGYCRGKSEGYLSSIESLSVLREFTPGLADMSPNKATFEKKLIQTMQMLEFYALADYLELPAVSRLGMSARRYADSTLAEKVERYRMWLLRSDKGESNVFSESGIDYQEPGVCKVDSGSDDSVSENSEDDGGNSFVARQNLPW